LNMEYDTNMYSHLTKDIQQNKEVTNIRRS
jgi:hypothetical protein